MVAWDCPIARIADRAGVDFISVGDSVGVNLWGHANPLEVTLDEMLVVCKAVRRGTAARAGELRPAVRAGAAGRRHGARGRDPHRQGRRRRHHQGRRGGRFPRQRAGAGARRHPGVRAVRAHAADRAQVRHPVRRAIGGGRAGAARADPAARRGGEAPGGRRRLAARLHQFGAGRGRRRGGGSRRSR